jgi:hypothetical protein
MRSRFLLSLLCIVFFTNLQAQVLGDRLTSLVNTDMVTGVFTPADSTTYVYKGIMNSNMKTFVYNYDTSVMYRYNSSAYHNYTLSRKSYTGWDSVSLLQQYNWNDTLNKWDSSADMTVSSNFDPITHLIQIRSVTFSVGASYELFYTYDGSNNLTQVLKIGAGSASDTQQRTMYTYSGSNLITAVTQIWLATPPPPAMPGFQNLQEIDYGYNSLNEDTIKVSKSWNPVVSTWNKDNITTYIYDASKKNIATYYSSFSPGLGFVPTARDSIKYDTANNVNNITKQSYDTSSHTYLNYKQTLWTFDPKWNVPLTLTTYSWVGSWVSQDGQDNQTRYHYTEYTNAVPNVNNAIGSISIYPVPTSNMLTIRMKWTLPQAFTVGIYDMEGRLLQQIGESATNNYQRTISVSDLAPGNYFVRINSKDVNMAQQFTVSK